MGRFMADIAYPIDTTHAGHAKDVVRALPLKQYTAIIAVSGDGVVHEILNGLMARADWTEVIKIPIGVIPCGTGNGIAKSIGTEDPEVATLNIIKGCVRKVDVLAVAQGGGLHYCLLFVSWALLSDCDILSERWRWMGDARFSVTGLSLIMSSKKYCGRMYYLPTSAVQSTAPREQSFAASNGAADPGEGASSSPFSVIGKFDLATLDRQAWKEVDSTFAFLSMFNFGWVSTDMLAAPFADPFDGAMDLVSVENASSRDLFYLFRHFSDGSYVHHPSVNCVHAKAVYLEPASGSDGIIDVDGERIEQRPVLVECVPNLVSLICPPGLSLPVKKLPEAFRQEDV